jgi:hypothetical protein
MNLKRKVELEARLEKTPIDRKLNKSTAAHLLVERVRRHAEEVAISLASQPDFPDLGPPLQLQSPD